MQHEAWLGSHMAYFWPLAWIALALFLGILVDGWALKRASRSRLATQHRWVGVGIDALRGGVLFWFAVAGIHAAMVTSALDRGVVRILDDVLSVLGFGSVTWVAARFAGGMIHLNAERLGARVLSPSLLATIAQSAIVAIGALVILQAMGVAIEPLLTALGVGGLAVALALQPTLANLFAGIQLVASGALRPGDYISVSGFDGHVEDVTWRTTTIRNVTSDVVIIPNLTLSTTPFVNYRVGAREIAIDVPFTVKAAANPDDAQSIAERAGRDALAALGASPEEGAARVRFEQLSDGNITAHLVLRVPVSIDAERARNETIKRLFVALQEKS